MLIFYGDDAHKQCVYERLHQPSQQQTIQKEKKNHSPTTHLTFYCDTAKQEAQVSQQATKTSKLAGRQGTQLVLKQKKTLTPTTLIQILAKTS